MSDVRAAARAWLSPDRFLDILALSEATPGPIAVNLATFAGFQVAGVSGALAATLGVCLPGAVLLLALGVLTRHLRDRPAFRAAMNGLRPALVGLLTATAIRLALALRPAGAAAPPPFALLLFAAALALLLLRKTHPLPLLAAAAAAGLLHAAFAAL